MEKTCSKCRQCKPADSFNKSKKSKLGLHNHCRSCQSECRKNWYLKNAELEKLKAKEYSKSDAGKQQRKNFYQNHKDRLLSRNRKVRKTDHARRLANIARRKKYKQDHSFRLAVNLRTRIRKALKGIDKAASTLSLLGCSSEALKLHLESKFTPGMTWDNYGFYGWHMDHIIPCSAFDLTKEEERKKCFHWTNLQPMWQKENMSKGGTKK